MTITRKRKANKSEEQASENKTEFASADQHVKKEGQQSITVIKEKRKLPPRAKKIQTQLQNEIIQEQIPAQKTRNPSTQKRKGKASANTEPEVKENSFDNEEPKELNKEQNEIKINEINEVNRSPKKSAGLLIKQKRKRVIKSKETISSGDEDLEEESISFTKISSINETLRSSLTSQAKSSKKRGIMIGSDNNKELKAHNARQQTNPVNKGKRGRKKLIKLEDEEVERNTNKASDIGVIRNETDEKNDQRSNFVSESKLAVENSEQGRITRQQIKLTNKGRRGRKKLIKLEEEGIEKIISKVSDTETIRNETEEKQDQTPNYTYENKLAVDNDEQDQRTKSTNKKRGRKKLIKLNDERNVTKVSDAEIIQNETEEKQDQTSNNNSENKLENGEQGRNTRQRTTNKGRKGRRKLIKLEDEVVRSIIKVSDADTIQNESEEKQDQALIHTSENRLVSENGERDREQLEDPDLPFGGRLTADEADTSRTRPDYYDKVRFENAKNKAEASMQPRQVITFEIEDQPQVFADATPKIRSIRFGDWEMDTWYVAPYPEEYSWYPTLYICEYCLKYMKSKFVADRHKMKCPMKHPPGDEIYRDGQISIFEVDGRKNTIYCQNLCLLAKMFLDHKTLYYDVEPFLFYVMTEINDTGCHFVGYFSKEKRSPLDYNVSCILTLPIHQRKGFGNLLIEFSYLLTKREGKTGSPEKPLSDLGLISYRYYWRNILFELFNNSPEALSIEDLSRATSMTVNDIIATLQINNMLVRDEENGTYKIVVDKDLIKNHLEKVAAKGYPRIRAENLRWTPFILTRVLQRTQDLENNKNMSNQEHQNSIDQFNKIVDDKMDVDD